MHGICQTYKAVVQMNGNITQIFNIVQQVQRCISEMDIYDKLINYARDLSTKVGKVRSGKIRIDL